VIVNGNIKQTIKFSEWMALEWENQVTARTTNMMPTLVEGLRTYALEHVEREQQTCLGLTVQWARLWEKVRVYLAGITQDGARDMVVDVEAEEFDPEDEEGMWRGTSLSRTKAPTTRTMMFDVQCKLR
jgi:predicted exporter